MIDYLGKYGYAPDSEAMGERWRWLLQILRTLLVRMCTRSVFQ